MPTPKPSRGLSLRTKVTLAAVGVLVAMGAVILVYNSTVTRNDFVKQRNQQLDAVLDGRMTELDGLGQERERLAVSLAQAGEAFLEWRKDGMTSNDRKSWEEMMQVYLDKEFQRFPGVVGGGIWYEPNVFDSQETWRGYYTQWKPPVGEDRKVEFTMEWSAPDADYHNQGWYTDLIPKDWDRSKKLAHDSVWTAPYQDPVTKVIMITVDHAMYADGKLVGMSTVDWNLDQITDVIEQTKPTPGSRAFLADSKQDLFVAVAGEKGLTLAATKKASWGKDVNMESPKGHFDMRTVDVPKLGRTRLYTTTLDSGLVFGLLVPEKEIMAPVETMQRNTWLILGAAILVAIGIMMLVSRRLFRPLPALTAAADRIALGDFGQTVEYRSSDEIGRLADSFRNLTDYVQDLGAAAEGMAQGDFSKVPEPRSDQDQLTKSFVKVQSTVEDLVDEASRLTDAAQSGDLHVRGEAGRFDGAYSRLVEGMNATLDAVVAPIEEASGVLADVARGDLRTRMHGEYQGEFAKIEESINTAVGNLDQSFAHVATAASRVADTAGEIETVSGQIAQTASSQSDSVERISQRVASIGESANAGRLEEVAAAVTEIESEVSQLAATADANAGMSDLASMATQGLTEQADLLGALVTAFTLTGPEAAESPAELQAAATVDEPGGGAS